MRADLYSEIGDVVRYQASNNGEKPFLIDPESGDSLSFLDFFSETERCSASLRDLGLSRGERVGVALENGITAAVAIVSVMMSGGVVVPINIGWRSREF